MLRITREEAELLQTFSLSLKMKNHRKLVDYFNEKFRQDPGSKTHAFNYGMCMSVYLLVDKNDSGKLGYLMDINEAFQTCLEHNEEWWLVRYLRSELNEEIPEEDLQETELLPVPVFNKVSPGDDRRILLRQQESAPEKYPYFISPYIAQARASIRNGDVDGAVEAYRKGLAAVPIRRSPYHFFYLTRPLYDTIICLRKMGETDLADEMKQHALTIFPGAGNLCMA